MIATKRKKVGGVIASGEPSLVATYNRKWAMWLETEISDLNALLNYKLTYRSHDQNKLQTHEKQRQSVAGLSKTKPRLDKAALDTDKEWITKNYCKHLQEGTQSNVC